MLKYNGSILKLPSKSTIDYTAPTIIGEYSCIWDWTFIHGTPLYSTVAIPFGNCTTVTPTDKCDLITTIAYRDGTSQQATVNNCLNVLSNSTVELNYKISIGTDNVSTLNFTAYIGICDANNLSNWLNNSIILDQISYNDTSGYWRDWNGTCSASNIKGILFFATTSDQIGSTPRLFGSFADITIKVM